MRKENVGKVGKSYAGYCKIYIVTERDMRPRKNTSKYFINFDKVVTKYL